MSARLAIVFAVALLSIGSSAVAGGAAKAHVQCMIDGGAPIKKGAKIGLDKDVWCTVYWDGKSAPPDGAAAKVTITEQRAGGPHTSDAVGGDLVGEDDMTYWQPQAAFKHGADFSSCGGFTVSAAITAGDQAVWSATQAIGVKCPKAKKLSAKLLCMMDGEDAQLRWPGNGDKLHPRMEKELDCSVASSTEPTAGTMATFTISHDDGTKAAKTVDFREYPGDKASWGFEQAFDENDYTPCSNFTLAVTIVDASGQQVFTTSHKFKQDCPD